METFWRHGFIENIDILIFIRLLHSYHEFIKELCHSAAYGFKCNSCCTLHSPRLLIATLLKEQLIKEFILDSRFSRASSIHHRAPDYLGMHAGLDGIAIN
jgi:hypothetical protein